MSRSHFPLLTSWPTYTALVLVGFAAFGVGLAAEHGAALRTAAFAVAIVADVLAFAPTATLSYKTLKPADRRAFDMGVGLLVGGVVSWWLVLEFQLTSGSPDPAATFYPFELLAAGLRGFLKLVIPGAVLVGMVLISWAGWAQWRERALAGRSTETDRVA